MDTMLAGDKRLYKKAVKAYYNSDAIMSDAHFDKLEAKIRRADPNWKALAKTGVAVNKKTEVALEHFMPSLNKFYPDKIDAWVLKQDVRMLVMNKLDGCSIQLIYNDGLPVKLITRGDGMRGGDISFLIPFLNIPKRIRYAGRIVLRCEAVLPTSTFKKKYADECENARAAVNGWLNRKTPSPGLADVHVVVLGVYDYKMANGLMLAESFGFKVVKHSVVTDFAKIRPLLPTRRKSSLYEMDGLVLCGANQPLVYLNADKPKWIAAYKENEDIATATKAVVEEIIWQTSGHNRLIPKIKIKPVRLGGVTVTYVTCHNAKWMVDRGIGPGAIIRVIRSGDVIPKIVGVVKKGKLQMPDVACEFVGVHLVATENSKEAEVRAIHKFFTTLGIEFIAQKTIATLYDAGFTSEYQYMKAWSTGKASTALHYAGLGLAMSDKIEAEFNRVFGKGVLLRDLMVASNCFDPGLGDRKLKAIEKVYSLAEIIKTTEDIRTNLLLGIHGFSHKTVALVNKGMVPFKKWLREALKYITVSKHVVTKVKAGKLSGVAVTFTGYRDAAQENYITDNGGEIVPFGSCTKILFYKGGGKTSSKIEKALAKGIAVTTFERWRK